MRWALFGASDIAATRMIPALRARGDVVSAVVSGSDSHGREFARRHGIARVLSDPVQAADASDVDAVYVSSRNEQHVELAVIAARAGKHVLCEKPVAVSVDGARLLMDVVADSGVVCAANHHLPGAATHRTIRRLVAAGAIGRPLAVSVAHAVTLPSRLQGWRLGADPGSGVVADITCHDASVVNALLGVPITHATAVGVRQGPWDADVVDAVVTALAYEDVVVQTHDAFTTSFRPTRFDVYGTEGAVLGAEVMTQDAIGTVTLRTKTGERLVDPGPRRDLYETVLAAFTDAVREVGRPTVDLIEGVNAFLVADAVNRSLAEGARVVVDTWFSNETLQPMRSGQHA